MVQWLDIIFSLAVAGDFLLASLSSLLLLDYVRYSRSRARRVGAASLSFVCAGLALEAAFFISQASMPASWTRIAATALVRSVLLGAASLIWVLLCRSGLRAGTE
jgi:hypothetical protein